MESLPSFGRDIAEALIPTIQTYAPLLAAQSSAISSTAKRTFSYGPSPRQTLDVYYPSKPGPEMQDKLLVFLYGGGFSQGDKTLQPLPIVYANVGHFFAGKHGVETIVIDYRLIQHGARFPSGGEDLQAALSWIEDRYKDKTVFLLGNSAGAVHVSTYLFDAEFKASRNKLLQGASNRLAGAVLVGMPAYSNGTDQDAAQYFGDELEEKQPIALLQRAKQEGGLSLPRILVMDSELDADMVKESRPTMVQELQESDAVSAEYSQIKGHNHFSPLLALGTDIGIEEAWGDQLVSWISS